MRYAFFVLSLVVLMLATPLIAPAQEPAKDFTLESLQAHFRYNYSPQEAIAYAKKAALWLSKQGKAGLKEFNNPYTKWNTQDGKHLQIQVWNSEDNSAIGHPNPALKHLVGKPNLLNQYKDHAGRLSTLEQMSRMKESPDGAWTTTKTTYIRSVTGVTEPSWILSFGVKVPNYPWYVVGHSPYQSTSYEEILTVVDDLNALVKKPSFAANETTKDELLAHFRYTTSPRTAFDHIQKAALWLSKQGKAGLDEFSKPYSQWNHLDGSTIQVQLWKSDECMVLRHPNPDLQHIVGVSKLGDGFKDHSGKLVALEQCTKLFNSPKGAFSATFTTYIKSVTGIEEPMYQLNFGVGVPGYPWQVVGHMPYQADSAEEMHKVVEDLNALVDEWSIIDQ
ncbi:MAG: hypothetical protein OCC46_09575 [Pseudodesulfovibrio sp.]